MPLPSEFGNVLALSADIWRPNNGEDSHLCLVEWSQLALTDSAKVLSTNGKTCLPPQLNKHRIIHFPGVEIPMIAVVYHE